MALPASETFTGASGSVSTPPWDFVEGVAIGRDGSGSGTQLVSGYAVAIWAADAFADDQHASIVAGSTLPGDATQYLGLVLRSDGLDQATGTMYQFYTDGGSDTQIAKDVAGTFTTLDTNNAITIAPGDILEFSVVGTALEVTLNGSSILTATDSDIASGSAGLIAYSSFGSGFLFFDDFAADDGGGGGGGGGSPHTVVGRGSVSITSPAWLKTELSGTVPAYSTTGMAEPTNYYHVGMISWGTAANGAMKAYPVTRLIDLVEVPAGMDTLWYEFASGITAVITELATP